MTVTVVGFTTHIRNTLRGFASIKIEELRLVVHDIGVHSKDGRSWVSLSGKPWIKNGEAVIDNTGKIKYSPIIEFDNTKVRDAFSTAVIESLLQHNPRALDCMGAVQ